MNDGAAGVDAGQPRRGGRVDVLLHQDLRLEVGDLRAGDHQRLAGRPTACARHSSALDIVCGSARAAPPTPPATAEVVLANVAVRDRAAGPAARASPCATCFGVVW